MLASGNACAIPRHARKAASVLRSARLMEQSQTRVAKMSVLTFGTLSTVQRRCRRLSTRSARKCFCAIKRKALHERSLDAERLAQLRRGDRLAAHHFEKTVAPLEDIAGAPAAKPSIPTCFRNLRRSIRCVPLDMLVPFIVPIPAPLASSKSTPE